jgi:hypothetical protein
MTYGSTDLLGSARADAANIEGIRILLAPESSGALHRCRGQWTGSQPLRLVHSMRVVLYGSGMVSVWRKLSEIGWTFEFTGIPPDPTTLQSSELRLIRSGHSMVGSEDRDGIG